MTLFVRNKFNAVRCEVDGIKFASKKERKRYLELKELQSCGKVLFFLRQVSLHLSGGVKYICDFLVFFADGRAEFEDVKGMKTPMYTLKKKQVEALYPIKPTEI